MPRRLIALCCVLVAGLCACRAGGDTATPDPVTTDFSCQADIRYRDMSIKGTLSRSNAGTLTLSFSQPDTLKGVSAQWTGDTVRATLHGLSFDLSPDTLPAGALGSVLIDALDAAVRAPTAGTLCDEGLRWEGSGKNGAITMLCDSQDGSLLSLEMPAVPLSASFTGFEKTVT